MWVPLWRRLVGSAGASELVGYSERGQAADAVSILLVELRSQHAALESESIERRECRRDVAGVEFTR